MRTFWNGLAILGLLLVASCTINVSAPAPESTSAQTEAASEQPVRKVPPREIPESETPRERPTRTPPSDSRACPSKTELPTGVDARACGPIPSGANTGNEAEWFVTPSGNIACEMGVDYVDCEALETVMIEDFQDLGSSTLCNGFSLGSETSPLCHGDPALWGSEYGDPA